MPPSIASLKTSGTMCIFCAFRAGFSSTNRQITRQSRWIVTTSARQVEASKQRQQQQHAQIQAQQEQQHQHQQHGVGHTQSNTIPQQALWNNQFPPTSSFTHPPESIASGYDSSLQVGQPRTPSESFKSDAIGFGGGGGGGRSAMSSKWTRSPARPPSIPALQQQQGHKQGSILDAPPRLNELKSPITTNLSSGESTDRVFLDNSVAESKNQVEKTRQDEQLLNAPRSLGVASDQDQTINLNKESSHLSQSFDDSHSMSKKSSSQPGSSTATTTLLGSSPEVYSNKEQTTSPKPSKWTLARPTITANPEPQQNTSTLNIETPPQLENVIPSDSQKEANFAVSPPLQDASSRANKYTAPEVTTATSELPSSTISATEPPRGAVSADTQENIELPPLRFDSAGDSVSTARFASDRRAPTKWAKQRLTPQAQPDVTREVSNQAQFSQTTEYESTKPPPRRQNYQDNQRFEEKSWPRREQPVDEGRLWSGNRVKSKRQSRAFDEVEEPYYEERRTFEDSRTKKKKHGKDRDKVKHGRDFVTDDYELKEYKRMQMEEQHRQAKKKRDALFAVPDLVPLIMPAFISVSNLANLLKVNLEIFRRKLQMLGFEDTSPDHVLNAENAGLIAMEYNYDPIIDRGSQDDLLPRPPAEDKSTLPLRPPVVTIMGHVDHGKTTLLDWLRKSSVVDSEHGGITQHIGAFSVPLTGGKTITFLDTPGHAAFLTMRERGANVTDIVILVVAADDSVMPQTVEAMKHAKAAKVPVIVAINKCDREDADVEKVKRDLIRHGLEIEDIGGDVQTLPVSGMTGLGMADLEEATVLQSEILDIRAETDGPCEGWVVESTMKARGRVATILVKRGTLRSGNILVAGTSWTRVRTLMDENGKELEFAPPGTPVEIDGWKNTPDAGDQVIEASNEDRARIAIDYRKYKQESIRQAKDMEAIGESRRIERERVAKEEFKAEQARLGITVEQEAKDDTPKLIEVPFIVKADVFGSVEAVSATVAQIGNNEVCAKVVRTGVGPPNQSDIDFAAAIGATCISFNVDTDNQIEGLARSYKVNLLEHNIIYRIEEDVKAQLSKLLKPEIIATVTGEAEVAQIFSISIKGKKQRSIAGSKVRNGLMTRNSKARVMRDGKMIYRGVLKTLKNVKKDVAEMRPGNECGISFEDWDDFLEGDTVQCFEEIEKPRFIH